MNRNMLAAMIAAGFLLDLLLGDPAFFYHPVRLVGKLIEGLERFIRRVFGKSERGLLFGGIVLAVSVVSITAGVSWLLVWAAERISRTLSFLLSCVMCYQLLAVKSLKTESMKVYAALKEGNLQKARKAVSMIVGRDTERLSETGVAKAAVETVAENTSDGVIAPLFYLAIGGPVLGWAYKAVNTMDSMIGYKNETYLYLGRAAARLDDVLNYIPARLSALLMIAASFLLGLDGKNAFKIFLRDRYNHASPNSAQTESVCAGALRVMLAGDAYYFGKLYKKKTIGDDLRPVEAEDIRRANRLLYLTSFLAVAAALLFEFLLRGGF